MPPTQPTQPTPIILSVSPSVILQSVLNPQIIMSGTNLLEIAQVLVNGKAARIVQQTNKAIIINPGPMGPGPAQITLLTKSGKSIAVSGKLNVVTVPATPKKQADRTAEQRRISANRGNLIK
jgi:hypothetical protein